MRPLPALLLAAVTALAIASSAQALPCGVPQWPPVPRPSCPVWPAPEPGGGIVGEAESILHTLTQANCDVVGDVDDLASITYTFAMGETAIVTNAMRGPVDATQDNVCVFLYGEPEPPKALACRPVLPECPTKVPPF